MPIFPAFFMAFAVMWGVNGWALSMGAPPTIVLWIAASALSFILALFVAKKK